MVLVAAEGHLWVYSPDMPMAVVIYLANFATHGHEATHVEVIGPCSCLGLCCQWSMLPLRAMRSVAESVTYVTTFGCPWSVLQPGAILMPVGCAALGDLTDLSALCYHLRPW